MSRKVTLTIVAVIVVVIASVGLYALIGSHNDGTLRLSAADAPVASGVTAVYITFSAVSLHKSSSGNSSNNTSGWNNYTMSSTTINIYGVTINNSSFIGNISIPAGNYQMIRVYITAVSVMINGVNISFNLSSHFGFLNHPFKVTAGSTTNLIFEFNLNQCLNITSKIFTPYIGVVLS